MADQSAAVGRDIPPDPPNPRGKPDPHAAGGQERYEVSALLGPCTQMEAEHFLDEVTSEDTAFAFGAVWALRVVEEDE